MNTDTVHHIGPLHVQVKWDWSGWHYVNRKDEQVNMWFYIGSVRPPERDCRLYQIVVGPFMMNWARQ